MFQYQVHAIICIVRKKYAEIPRLLVINFSPANSKKIGVVQVSLYIINCWKGAPTDQFPTVREKLSSVPCLLTGKSSQSSIWNNRTPRGLPGDPPCVVTNSSGFSSVCKSMAPTTASRTSFLISSSNQMAMQSFTRWSLLPLCTETRLGWPN